LFWKFGIFDDHCMVQWIVCYVFKFWSGLLVLLSNVRKLFWKFGIFANHGTGNSM
jgi:hypothetical protein